ncbi:MAG: thioesterase family protein [Microthrixaceae bacterium]
MAVQTGLSSSIELDVTDADTALAIGSGDVAVLSTPRIIALVEQAAFAAVADELAAGQTTVGVGVRMEHISPTAVGRHVRAEVCVEKVEGRRLVFTVSAHDDHGLVAAGKVTRVVVDRDGFMAKAR